MPEIASGQVPDTFPRLLVHHVEVRAGSTAMREKDLGIWQCWTWRDVAEHVRALAAGLAEMGFRRGNHLAIVGDNRPRLYMMIAAAQCLGGVPVPLYQDAVASEMLFALVDAGARFVLSRIRSRSTRSSKSGEQLPGLVHLFYDDPRGMRHYTQPFVHDVRELIEMGRIPNRNHPDFLPEQVAAGRTDEVGVMLCPSGATGWPKGVRLTDAAFIAAARGGAGFDRLTADEDILSYLPMAWVGDHLFSFAQALVAGFTINGPESAETVMADMREIGPTYYLAPPRVFENLPTQVMIRMDGAGVLKQWMFHFFMAVSRRCGAMSGSRR